MNWIILVELFLVLVIVNCFLFINFQDIEASKNSDEILASLLKVAVRCLHSPEKHFAEVMSPQPSYIISDVDFLTRSVIYDQVVRNSIKGLGTDEDSLTRVIITRAEVDMKKIKEEYKRFGRSINDDIKGDASGDYMKFLLTLVGWAIP